MIDRDSYRSLQSNSLHCIGLLNKRVNTKESVLIVEWSDDIDIPYRSDLIVSLLSSLIDSSTVSFGNIFLVEERRESARIWNLPGLTSMRTTSDQATAVREDITEESADGWLPRRIDHTWRHRSSSLSISAWHGCQSLRATSGIEHGFSLIGVHSRDADSTWESFDRVHVTESVGRDFLIVVVRCLRRRTTAVFAWRSARWRCSDNRTLPRSMQQRCPERRQWP